ncbi:hypothetical protein GJ496_011110 [Pomphorhynchus laevis]|nr:hypothetical protein GJ496_011110 [Pomphorhynchus laevis]
MLNFFNTKSRRKSNKNDNTNINESESVRNSSLPNKISISPAQIRAQKDIIDITSCKAYEIIHPDPDDLMHFQLYINPDEGYYNQGRYEFEFTLTEGYPHEPPKVKCKTEVFHPNIDSDGNVCLNILREDWKPVLNLNAVVLGIYHLFLEPNYQDPLNKDAANMLKTQPERFKDLVDYSISKSKRTGAYYSRR